MKTLGRPMVGLGSNLNAWGEPKIARSQEAIRVDLDARRVAEITTATAEHVEATAPDFGAVAMTGRGAEFYVTAAQIKRELAQPLDLQTVAAIEFLRQAQR